MKSNAIESTDAITGKPVILFPHNITHITPDKGDCVTVFFNFSTQDQHGEFVSSKLSLLDPYYRIKDLLGVEDSHQSPPPSTSSSLRHHELPVGLLPDRDEWQVVPNTSGDFTILDHSIQQGVASGSLQELSAHYGVSLDNETD